MDRMEECKALRGDTEVHYNCAQAVLIPFGEACGLEREEARNLGAHFGSGMRCGGMCGAVTGALMVLGMAGADEAAATALLRKFREKNGALNCAELLAAAKDRGEARKPHCDRLVYEAVELLEEQLGD